MKLVKKAITGSLVSACTVMASAAMAAGYTVGGATSGTGTIAGPTTLGTVSGNVPCSLATFTLSLLSGSAKVTNATFSGSAACLGVRTVMPWPVQTPTASTGPNNVVITGITVFVPAPVNKTCTGWVNGSLDNSGNFTFAGTLATGCQTRSTSTMTSSPTADAVFP